LPMKKINRVMGSLGGIIIGIMMLLTVAEVLSRFFLGISIEGVIETVGILLAFAVFLGFSHCEESGNHVRVELVVRLLPNKIALVVDLLVYVLAILIIATMTWQAGVDALSSWSFREVLPGANIQVPVYPAKIAAFIGLSAFCFQLVLNFVSRTKSRPDGKVNKS